MSNKRKDCLINILCIFLPPILHSVLYFIAKLVEGNPYDITTNIDNKIPFIAWFIIFYCIWYLLLIISPLIIYKFDKSVLKRYSCTYVLCSLISFIIYIVFPTTFIRPLVDTNGLFNYTVNKIYSMDVPILNCFPSFHCVLSILWIIFIGINKKVNKYIRSIILFISIGVILSTMFIKQHSYLDVIGAFILVVISYFIILKFNKEDVI